MYSLKYKITFVLKYIKSYLSKAETSDNIFKTMNNLYLLDFHNS